VKCKETFLSVKILINHQNKKIPCDFKCLNCPFKGKNRHQYYRHTQNGCILKEYDESNKIYIDFPDNINDSIIKSEELYNAKDILPNEYIYLIRLREFVRLNEKTYKIGRTKRTLFERLQAYPKGSEFIVAHATKNSIKVEKDIKKHFINKYTQMKEYGSEYFQGDPKEMKEDISMFIQ
jgi:hypothetical protein